LPATLPAGGVRNRMKEHNLIQTAYWDSVAANNKVFGCDEMPYPAKREMERFFEFSGFKGGENILEIGCGTGRYTLALLRMGCRVCATDISSESISVLKKSAEARGLDNNLSLEVDTFEDSGRCSRFTGKFDYVLFVAVIHHLDPAKKEDIIANAVKSLKAGGKIIALEPNPFNPLYYLLYFWRWCARIKGKNRWATEKGFLRTSTFSLKKLFHKSGLKNIKVCRYAWLPSVLGNSAPFILPVNDILNKIPVVREMSAFTWMSAEK